MKEEVRIIKQNKLTAHFFHYAQIVNFLSKVNFRIEQL
jgi:hypothetical protein